MLVMSCFAPLILRDNPPEAMHRVIAAFMAIEDSLNRLNDGLEGIEQRPDQIDYCMKQLQQTGNALERLKSAFTELLEA